MTPSERYLIEEEPGGRTLVVTGSWSGEASQALARGEADGLVLNYARGFSSGDLEFLEAGLGVRRLRLLDRGISDLGPIARLSDSLEELSVQASENASLDLSSLLRLHSLASEWGLIRDTVGTLDGLRSLTTWRFDEADLRDLRDHP